MNTAIAIPQVPLISNEELAKCREKDDFTSIFFEWYKFVCELCSFFAHIQPDSEILKSINPIHYTVLIGLLNRCSRLMFSNIALSHNGLFGETTSIIDRCIFESCVKIVWLCNEKSEGRFNQFLSDGLKTELKLKENIYKEIEKRGNKRLAIEERMLHSIENYISSSGLTEEEIQSAVKLPTLFNMIDIKNKDLFYIVGQKIGSHHVHGTWISLLHHYIEMNENGIYFPKGHNCKTHINQYVFIPLIALIAMKFFIKYVIITSEDIRVFSALIESTTREIYKINDEAVGKDFDII